MVSSYSLVALAFLSLVAPSSQFTHYEEGTCHLIGDPDLYGVGVRVSYYLAFFSGIIALVSSRAEVVDDVRKGNAIVSLALFIVLVRNSLRGSLAVFEWQLIFTMMLFLLSVAFVPLIFLGGWTSAALLFITYGLFSVLLPWVYFDLVDQGRMEGCELKMFLFTHFDFYNVHWIGFLKFQSIMACLVGVVCIIVGLGFIACRLWFGWDDIPSNRNNDSEDNWSRAQFALSALLVGIVTIIFAEKLISVNNVDLSEVSLISTSQLIPFLVGIITFISTVLSIWDGLRKDDLEGCRACGAKPAVPVTFGRQGD
jgi:hypothetical protein